MARLGLWVALPMPALSTLQSWYQGAILHSRRTRGITESVAIFLAASAAVLFAGVVWGGATGLYVGLAGMVIATLAQTVWLWWRARAAFIPPSAGTPTLRFARRNRRRLPAPD